MVIVPLCRVWQEEEIVMEIFGMDVSHLSYLILLIAMDVETFVPTLTLYLCAQMDYATRQMSHVSRIGAIAMDTRQTFVKQT